MRGTAVITGPSSSQVPERNVPAVSLFRLGADRPDRGAEGFSFSYLTQPNTEEKSLSLPLSYFPNA